MLMRGGKYPMALLLPLVPRWEDEEGRVARMNLGRTGQDRTGRTGQGIFFSHLFLFLPLLYVLFFMDFARITFLHTHTYIHANEWLWEWAGFIGNEMEWVNRNMGWDWDGWVSLFLFDLIIIDQDLDLDLEGGKLSWWAFSWDEYEGTWWSMLFAMCVITTERFMFLLLFSSLVVVMQKRLFSDVMDGGGWAGKISRQDRTRLLLLVSEKFYLCSFYYLLLPFYNLVLYVCTVWKEPKSLIYQGVGVSRTTLDRIFRSEVPDLPDLWKQKTESETELHIHTMISMPPLISPLKAIHTVPIFRMFYEC
jgi:hypothetical protein